MGMILHTIVIHDPGVVVAGGICPVRTCLVNSNVMVNVLKVSGQTNRHERTV